MKERFNKLTLLMYDKINQTQNVCELEMMVDRIIDFEPAYVIQFQRDAYLYSYREALRYLSNFCAERRVDKKIMLAELAERIRVLGEKM